MMTIIHLIRYTVIFVGFLLFEKFKAAYILIFNILKKSTEDIVQDKKGCRM